MTGAEWLGLYLMGHTFIGVCTFAAANLDGKPALTSTAIAVFWPISLPVILWRWIANKETTNEA